MLLWRQLFGRALSEKRLVRMALRVADVARLYLELLLPLDLGPCPEADARELVKESSPKLKDLPPPGPVSGRRS
jgi:hypothetical protein